MKTLKLTIVIPAYNEESHIKDCLDSIANLDEAPDEVILVDNNSTDKTVEIAKQYDFVRIVKEKKQGVLYARTTGFNKAKSDIIGRIDAETHLPSDWIARVKTIFEDKEVDAVSGSVSYHDAPFRSFGRFFDKNMRKITWNIGVRNDAVFLFGSNMAIRKTAWEDVKKDLCSRQDIHEDIDIAIHLYRLGSTIAFDEELHAMTSSRRMLDPMPALLKYLKLYKYTYDVHDIKSPAIGLASTFVLSTKFGVNLVQRAYDKETERLSIKKFIAGINQDEFRESPVKSD